MSGQYPPLTPAQVETVLKNAGFAFDRSEGSHFTWEGYIGGQRRIVTVDHFGGQKSETFSKDLMQRIIRQSGLSRKEFYNIHFGR
jgi:predicted RNA binding protein YcfA (HicA-like mRNA interferase family)